MRPQLEEDIGNNYISEPHLTSEQEVNLQKIRPSLAQDVYETIDSPLELPKE